MRRAVRCAVAAGAAMGLSAWLAPLAAGAEPAWDGSAVFAQTDNPAGNQVLAFDRAEDGTLAPAGTYSTGGLGGQLNGSVVDHLASQGGLAIGERGRTLLAVNAGSNTVSVFGVDADRIRLHQIVGSGGSFPSSIAVHGDLVYVLNSTSGGSVAGFRMAGEHLVPIPGSVEQLDLPETTDASQFTHTPGQVAFTPDGRQLLVTTKATTSAVEVFRVRANGRLSAPTVNPEPGAVPFAVTFDDHGNAVVADAGTNALSSFAVQPDGALAPITSVPTGQAATCWITSARGRFYASNAGSGTLSTVNDASGQLTLAGQTSTDPGTVDSAATPGGHYLYVQTGATGAIDEFRVDSSGALTEIGSVPGAAGAEGIVAS